ncbi:MAG: sugar transferase [Anaerofustis stercorihominis]|nr:sugar transferase [Anaerofustis stercorihominis]
MYNRFIKRAIDIVLSLTAMILFGWLFLLLMLIVRINMGSPVFYSSQRAGRGEKPFRIYKFRSMTNETDENGVLLPSPQRLTKFGRLLRSTSLDELPSLWNILKGELSIVGPRPLPMKYLPYYREDERVRHAVRPGLTGWAQVNGRNAISWDDKFSLDAEYVENMSLLFDIKVLLYTVIKVIKRSDIIQDDQQTASLHIVRADMNKQTDELS